MKKKEAADQPRQTRKGSNRGRKSKKPPAYFLSLELENIRCFGPCQKLDLSGNNGRPAQWTLILGDNGTGKTTLLRGLACMSVEPWSRAEAYLPQVMVVTNQESYSLTRDTMLNSIRSDQQEAQIRVGIHTGNMRKRERSAQAIQYLDLVLNTGGTLTTQGASEISSNLKVYGYGANRNMGSASLTAADTRGLPATLFDDSTELMNVEEWLLQTDYAASKPSPVRDRSAERHDLVVLMLLKLLPDVDEVRITDPTKTNPEPRAEFHTPYGWVKIDDLSLGYKTMIAWMVDLAARLFERYPDSKTPMAEPAIVLVDEIDLHLHPVWQRNIMRYLSERFPNTQFVATAHSPLVVQAATDKTNIAILRRDGDHVVIDNTRESVQKWRIDQLLTSDLFGLDSARGPRYDNLKAERKALLQKSRLTPSEKSRLSEIDSILEELPGGETREDMRAMDIIQRAARKLRKGDE